MNSLTKALELYEQEKIARLKLRVHRKLANSCLPKHKQAKFDNLLTQCVVKLKNAEMATAHVYEKLSRDDKMAFQREYRFAV